MADTAPRIEAALTVPEDVLDLLLGTGTTDAALGGLAGAFQGTGDGPAEIGILVFVGRDCGAAPCRRPGRGASRCWRRCGWRTANLPLRARPCGRSCAMRSSRRAALPRGLRRRLALMRAEIARIAGESCILDAPRFGLWAAAGLDAPEHAARLPPPAPEATLFADSPGAADAGRVPLLERIRLTERFSGAPEPMGAALRARAGRSMAGLAQPVESGYGFDDLVLSPTAMAQLASFVAARRAAHPRRVESRPGGRGAEQGGGVGRGFDR